MKLLQKHFFKGLSILVLIGFFFTSCKPSTSLNITDLKCEYRTNPLGIDNTTPRLSWKLTQENLVRGEKQTAYQIIVASSLEKL